ncbi:hypothetical protein Salat_2606100 [Sesamum alatum]|uniref:ZF-HD dimerization-type domain-containing protein n=1 Tax=Sesamum alatum TaxID=300844 RepID=A0AAE1XN92_9LAMI|nr:hypothetical protein Salat_2606100 [Sesamum alatum]
MSGKVDGCQEYVKSWDSPNCRLCGCHRSFHRKVVTPVKFKTEVVYTKCHKIHEFKFIPPGEDGTATALNCAICGCHKSFHRNEGESEVAAAVGGGEHEDAGGDSKGGDGEGDDFVDSDYELGAEDVGRVDEEIRTEEEGRVDEEIRTEEEGRVDEEIVKDTSDSSEARNESGNDTGQQPMSKRAGKRKVGETADLSELREVDTDVTEEQPTILPPLQVPFEDEQCPEACVTQEEVQCQTPAAPVYMPGPSMK